MPPEDKPYRVYRGGRVKGRVPTLTRPHRDGRAGPRPTQRYTGPGPKPKRRRFRWSRKRWVALGLLLLLTLLIAWGVAGYLAVKRGVDRANARVTPATKAELTPQSGLLLSHATNVLLLGTDSAPTRSRAGLRHSDSIMLVRSDPGKGRLIYLSIPRDLRVLIPGSGENKINAAFQFGGAPLAIRTIKAYTGLPVHHVAIVNFPNFRDTIDALGGVTIDVQKPILSNPFDCPYTPRRCERWPGWRFGKGEQRMDGRRALIYSRIRKNQLDGGESDVTRAARQQQVIDAIGREVTGVGTFFRMPWIGEDLVKPLTTDLSSGQLMQLGWRRFRASGDRTLNCRLGGTPEGGYIVPDDVESRRVIAVMRGESAPQPPPPDNPRYGSGCVIGRPFR